MPDQLKERKSKPVGVMVVKGGEDLIARSNISVSTHQCGVILYCNLKFSGSDEKDMAEIVHVLYDEASYGLYFKDKGY